MVPWTFSWISNTIRKPIQRKPRICSLFFDTRNSTFYFIFIFILCVIPSTDLGMSCYKTVQNKFYFRKPVSVSKNFHYFDLIVNICNFEDVLKFHEESCHHSRKSLLWSQMSFLHSRFFVFYQPSGFEQWYKNSIHREDLYPMIVFSLIPEIDTSKPKEADAKSVH